MRTRDCIVSRLRTVGRRLAVLVLVGSAGLASGADRSATPTTPTPPNLQVLEGRYYWGNGLAYNFDLSLKPGGDYKTKWHSCLHALGEASGNWHLSSNSIVFSPAIECEMLKTRIEKLPVEKHGDEWGLVPTDIQDGDALGQQRIRRSVKFQRIDTLSRWAGVWESENGAMGEFHTVELRKEGDFSWFFRDEPLGAEDTYRGKWHIQDDALHVLFLSGSTKSGEKITPKRSNLILNMSHSRESLIQADHSGFRLERRK